MLSEVANAGFSAKKLAKNNTHNRKSKSTHVGKKRTRNTALKQDSQINKNSESGLSKGYGASQSLTSGQVSKTMEIED